jgi:hypothetical protein
MLLTVSKVLALALGLSLGSCAIQPPELYEVTNVIYTSPDVIDVYSGQAMLRTDIMLTDKKVLVYQPDPTSYNKLALCETHHTDSIVDYNGRELTIKLAKDCTVTYFLFDLQNHYE